MIERKRLFTGLTVFCLLLILHACGVHSRDAPGSSIAIRNADNEPQTTMASRAFNRAHQARAPARLPPTRPVHKNITPPADPIEMFISGSNRSQVIFSKYTTKRTYDLARLNELIDEAMDAFQHLQWARGRSEDDVFNDHWQLCINNGMIMMFDTTAEEDPRYQARYGMILHAMQRFKDWGQEWEDAGYDPCMTWFTITVAGNEAVIGWVDDGTQPHVVCQRRLKPTTITWGPMPTKPQLEMNANSEPWGREVPIPTSASTNLDAHLLAVTQSSVTEISLAAR